jgi:hypothetical protein
VFNPTLWLIFEGCGPGMFSACYVRKLLFIGGVWRMILDTSTLFKSNF